jgi:hypothetical protein
VSCYPLKTFLSLVRSRLVSEQSKTKCLAVLFVCLFIPFNVLYESKTIVEQLV